MRSSIVLLLISISVGNFPVLGLSSDATYQRVVYPVLEQFCVDCHGPKKQKAKLRLDTLSSDFAASASIETWHDVLDKLNAGEMPPEKAKQPSPKQLAVVVDWLTDEIQQVKARQRSTGGRAVLRRMTRYEYANTLRDLLGIDARFGADLPPEPTSADGFKNNGAMMGMSPIQLEYYLSSARAALRRTIVTGPKPEIFEHVAKTSEKAKRKKGPVGNRLEPGGRFLARAREFPREGDVRVQVRARAEIPDGAPFPRLRVTLGVRSDVKSFVGILGEIDLVESSDEASTFEFRGRIEDFPLPGHNPKYPGLLINVWHVDSESDTSAKKKAKKKRTKKKGGAAQESPAQPLILVESVRFAGPVFESWPPARHRRILIDSSSKDDETEYAREVLTKFTRRAYRRAPDASEISVLLSFFQKVRPRFDSFEETIRETLAMALISPAFLYLVEPRTDDEKRQRLSDDELATRLSYFLWSTMPDDELFAMADRGALRDPAELERQVRSMIRSPRSSQFVEHFTSQWLDLSGLDRIAVNPEFYPDFDNRLKADMRAETLGFFAEILKQDLSALELIDSDFTIVNRRLAKHYGIQGPRGSRFERIALEPGDRRGGILTHGSVLLINSNGEDSHPIKRAVWLLDRLLDDPPAPPPPDVPELSSDEPDFARLPLVEQLRLHRKKPACDSCHRRIDPWGIPFENYDAVGRWRTEVQRVVKKRRKKTTPVAATSTLPDGRELAGMVALKRHLLDGERRRFARALVKKLLAYALARTLEIGDDAVVDSLTDSFESSDYKLSDLIVRLVKSEPFHSK
jgi:hypothetical protein